LRVQTSDEDESKHYDMLSSLRSEFCRSQKEAELLKQQAEVCEQKGAFSKHWAKAIQPRIITTAFLLRYHPRFCFDLLVCRGQMEMLCSFQSGEEWQISAS
jgi:hypothetical protein